MSKSVIFAIVLLFTQVGFVSLAQAKRVALVIGIGEYEKLTDLSNPANDAKAMAGLLRQHGFLVAQHLNLTSKDLRRAVKDFETLAKDASEALVFYAGHGMAAVQENRLVNVLVPTDANYQCGKRVIEGAVAIEDLVRAVRNVPNKAFLFDACRNDPFENCEGAERKGFGYQQPSARDLAALSQASADQNSRGLSRPRETPAGRTTGVGEGGALVGFSTDLGAFAGDGKPGENSPFTKVLLAELSADPKRPFREVLDRTSNRVKEETQFYQVPWVVTKGGEPAMCLAGDQCRTSRALLGEKLRERSVALTLAAEDYLRRKEPSKAVELALNALPRKLAAVDARPLVPEALTVLRKAMTQVKASAITEYRNVLRHGVKVNAAAELLLAQTADGKGATLFSLDGEELGTFGTRQKWVEAFDLSPDGRRILTAENGGTAYIWDRQGRIVSRLTGHKKESYMGENSYFREAAFSPDGKLVVTTGMDFTVRIWNESGRQIARLRHKHYPMAAVLAPNMQFVVTAEGKNLFFWSLTGKKLRTIKTQEEIFAPHLHISPDSKFVVGFGGFKAIGQRLYFWTARGKPLGRFSNTPGAVKAYGFVGTGNEIAVMHASDKGLNHWLSILDLSKRKARRAKADKPTSIAASKGQNRVAAIVEGSHFPGRKIAVWSLRPWRTHDFAMEGDETVARIDILPKTNEVMVVVDASTSKTLDKPPEALRSIRWPLADRVSVSGRRSLPLETIIGGGRPVTLTSPSGNRAVVASHTENAQIWDHRTGKRIDLRIPGRLVTAGSRTPESRLFILGLAGGTVLVSDWNGKRLSAFSAHRDKIRAIVACTDVNELLTVGGDGSIRHWTMGGRELGAIPATAPKNFKLFADSKCGRLTLAAADFATSKPRIMTFERRESPKSIWLSKATIDLPEFADTSNVRANKDGTLILSVDNNLVISIWRWDGTLLRRLNGHKPVGQDWAMPGLTLIQDDTKLISSASDGTLRYWDIESGKGEVIADDLTDAFSLGQITVADDGKTLAVSGGYLYQFDGKTWRRSLTRLPPIQVEHIASDGDFLLGRTNQSFVMLPLYSNDQKLIDTAAGLLRQHRPLTTAERCRYALETATDCANAN